MFTKVGTLHFSKSSFNVAGKTRENKKQTNETKKVDTLYPHSPTTSFTDSSHSRLVSHASHCHFPGRF